MDGGAERCPWRRARVCLVWHALANGLLVAAIALGHSGSGPWPASDAVDRAVQQCLAAIEGVLIPLAAVSPLALICRWSPRAGLAAGAIVAATIPVLYYADVSLFLIARERLLSGTMARVIPT